MTSPKLKIVSVCSEVDPFAKTGGMADVARSLPKSLKRLGHLVRVITPLHSQTDKVKHHLKLIKTDVPLDIDSSQTLKFNIWQGYLMENLPVYFIEEKNYLSKQHSPANKPQELYISDIENQRFMIFALAALTTLTTLNIKPDIIQCHDWHTGLIPYFLKTKYQGSNHWQNTTTVFTIHNLSYQMGNNWWEVPPHDRDNGYDELPNFTDNDKLRNINFAKRGIRYADAINTVSEKYAEEIMTKKFGNDLHGILKWKKNKLFGIVNGIDYTDWNPSTDPGLVTQYDYDSLANKTKNKLYLQKFLGLPENPKIPLIGWTSRLTEQKGIELIIEIIEPLLRMDLQLVVLGEGAKKYESFFTKMSQQHPKKIAALLDFDNQKETMVLAGADIFLLPSRFEPCGLAQLKSLRYGAIPVVHEVGGLADTISNYNPKTKRGNGFVFKPYDSRDLLLAIGRAVENHQHRDAWLSLVRHAMRQSFSWELPAQKYVLLFRKALRLK